VISVALNQRTMKWQTGRTCVLGAYPLAWICDGMRKERPANDDMVEGFRDGYDLTLPEPGANRSHSYRHGFMCARIDKGVIKHEFNAGELREMADTAMMIDETNL
jgi:hypothetical protein